jgi:hypothetical protein
MAIGPEHGDVAVRGAAPPGRARRVRHEVLGQRAVSVDALAAVDEVGLTIAASLRD